METNVEYKELIPLVERLRDELNLAEEAHREVYIDTYIKLLELAFELGMQHEAEVSFKSGNRRHL